MSYECVPLYDTLGENAVEFIINHSEAVITIVDGRKLSSLAGAVKGINTAQCKNVVYWGAEDAASVQVSLLRDCACMNMRHATGSLGFLSKVFSCACRTLACHHEPFAYRARRPAAGCEPAALVSILSVQAYCFAVFHACRC
jgi:hypothetical protein